MKLKNYFPNIKMVGERELFIRKVKAFLKYNYKRHYIKEKILYILVLAEIVKNWKIKY